MHSFSSPFPLRCSSETNFSHTLSMFFRRALASYRCLPDAHYPVVISRGDACSVRGPGDREHFTAMIAVGQRGSTRHAIAYLNGPTGVG